MAENGKRRARAGEWLTEYAYLVTLLAVVAVIAASALYTRQLRRESEQAKAAAAQAAEIAATPRAQATPLAAITPLSFGRSTFAPRIVTVRPVSGAVSRAFSPQPVHWEALGVIQAHEGIDIAGEKDESVFAVMDGVVTGAAMDALWGWRVSIDHTDGSEGVYAGLALSYVRAGESVSRGEEIGVLMECVPCEAELGPHLHFEWLKNGVREDPKGILPS